jgi:hypothetical protein
VGDLPRTATGYFGSTARREAEQTAFHEVVETLSSVIRDTYEEIHKEYEQRSSLAARGRPDRSSGSSACFRAERRARARRILGGCAQSGSS